MLAAPPAIPRGTRNASATAFRAGRRTLQRGRAALGRAVLVGVVSALVGCTATHPPLPPRPPLPAVRFVPPCDPQATVGLTAEGVEQLRARDAAWRQYSESLERVLRGAQ